MGKKVHTPKQIIGKLREAEILLAQGHIVPQIGKQLGLTDQTYYRWRKGDGGMQVIQAKRLKELERENARLKRLVARRAQKFALAASSRICLSRFRSATSLLS